MKNRLVALSLASAAFLALATSVMAQADQTASAPTTGATTVLRTAPLMTPSRGTQVGFVDGKGFAVYVFDRDLAAPGTSQCSGACLAHWPAITPPKSTLAAPWGTIVRSDGTKQLTYEGRPLYSYVADTDAKEAKGDQDNARGGIWHLAQAQMSTAPASAPTPSSMY